MNFTVEREYLCKFEVKLLSRLDSFGLLLFFPIFFICSFMSYDRVLPKPATLYHDSSRQDNRSRNNALLEHRIMTDKFSKIAEEGDGSRRPNSLLVDKALQAAPLPQPLAPRSSVNCEEPMTEGTKVPLTRRRVATLASGIPDNRDNGQKSPPLGSPKSASSKESAVQFCLCQPDPKIPRPRNGKWETFLSFVFISLMCMCSFCHSN